ncbi:MAG: hypothetical protein K6C09_05075, partial [Oscillospiraceae bacterium]|nr:hypothetical protein [Oscillospiraceae bacterium]
KDYDMTDIGKLSDYLEVLEKEEKMPKEFDALDEQDLRDAEELYYVEVLNRCNTKLAEVAYKIG